MNNILRKIGEYKLIPVVISAKVEDAIPLGKAVLEGGLPLIEVTFRTEEAVEVIRVLAQNFPEMLIGAGTILTIEQVKQAVDAGAKFIVAPGFNPKVVDYCVANDIVIIPGISCPTIIEMALEKKLDVVKFFPAEALGGIKFLKAIAAPYPNIKFIPTGGITQDNLADYLEHKQVLACGGSWVVKNSLIAEKKFSAITSLVKQARDVIK